MDPEDVLELGLLFGGFELLETVGVILLGIVMLVVIAGAILVIGPDMATIAVLLVVTVGSAIAGGLAGMKAERLRRKTLN